MIGRALREAQQAVEDRTYDCVPEPGEQPVSPVLMPLVLKYGRLPSREQELLDELMAPLGPR